MNPSWVERVPAPLPILFAILAVLWTVPPEVHPLGAVLVFLLLAALSLTVLFGPGLVAGEQQFLMLLCLPLGLSFHAALDTGAAVDRLLLICGAVILFISARRLSAAGKRGVMLLLVAGGATLSLYGAWQYLYGLERLLALVDPSSEAAFRLSTGRVFSRFMLPSAFASFLLLALPVALALTREQVKLRRFLTIAAAGAMMIALLLTRSHGALAALLATVFLWRVVAGGQRRTWTAGLLVLILAGLALVAWSRDGALMTDASDLGPAALRLRNARTAVVMLVDHPVQGLGGGGYGAAYPSYRQPGDNETHHVHNSFLQLLVEHGLTMAIPLGWLLLSWARVVRRALASHEAVQIGLAMGVTAFLVHNLMDFSGLLPSTLWTAAVLAGIATNPPSAEPSLQAAPPFRRLAPAALGAAVILLVAATGILTGLARHRLELAQQQVTAGDLPLALRETRRSMEWAPWRAEGHLLAAEILIRHPDLVGSDAGWAAWQAADEALRWAPYWPAAHSMRALASARMGQPGLAAADFQRAADLYPMEERYPGQLESLAAGMQAQAEERP